MKRYLVSVVLFFVAVSAFTQVLQEVTGTGRAEPLPRALGEFEEKAVGVMGARPHSMNEITSCTAPKGALSVGSPVTAFLGDADTCYDPISGIYVDFWTFSAQAGQQATVSFTSTPQVLVTIQSFSTGDVLASSASKCGLATACSFTYTILSSSQYLVGVGGNRTGTYRLTLTTSGTPPPSGLPNLTPYKVLAGGTCTPTDLCNSDWSDKIVVSRVPGTHVDSGSLSPTDTLYVDWAAINSGTADAMSLINIELYVDGALRQTWHSDPPLEVNTYVAVQDYSIGSLPAGTHSIRIRIDSTNAVAETNESDNEYTKTFTVGSSQTSCTGSDATLCLNTGRFRVTAAWQTATGAGSGTAVALTGDTGYFWFFSSGNVEMVIKVVDGRPVNGKFWVFAGGLTNVHVVITVTDTATGAVKTYINPQGTAFQAIQDTAAF